MTNKNDPELELHEKKPANGTPQKGQGKKIKSKLLGKKAVKRVEELESGQPSTMFYMHSLLLFSGKLLHRVLNFYNSFFDLKPADRATIYRNISNQYANKGLYDKAMHYLREWSRLEPTNADAHYHLGIALASAEDADGAIRSFDKVIELKPNHKAALYRRAGLNLKAKDYQKAVEDLQKLSQIVPENPKPFYLLGIAFDRMDEVEKAVEAMKQAISLDSEEIKYFQHLGFLYERKEDHKMAAKCFSRVMELQREQDEE